MIIRLGTCLRAQCVPLLLCLAGVIVIRDGLRITEALRRPGIYDIVGPDRYLVVVGVLLLICGAGLALQAIGPEAGDDGEPQVETEDSPAPHGSLRPMLLLFGALMAYAVTLPWLGYLLSTLLFLGLAFYLSGVEGGRRIVFAAVALSVGFQVVFVQFADMAMPSGRLLEALQSILP